MNMKIVLKLMNMSNFLQIKKNLAILIYLITRLIMIIRIMKIKNFRISLMNIRKHLEDFGKNDYV